ncbi:MAG: DUF805 domain-containing protein [Alphaproteobacteria bacterium]|nr:DUF805 domain-containing protein [Alphaproteobacteria bacterium]
MFGFLFSPYGRISRKTYWLNFLLPYIAITIVATILDFAIFEINPETGEPPPVFQGILALIALWPSIATTTKRLHDRGMTGWWQAAQAAVIVALATAAYWYYTAKVAGAPIALPTEIADQEPSLLADAVLIMGGAIIAWLFLYPLINALFLRGQAGPNKYGDDPLGHPSDTFK